METMDTSITNTLARVALAESPELVCVATSRDVNEVNRWRSLLMRFAIPVQVQTYSVREPGNHDRTVYLIYVNPNDEDLAVRLVQPQLDLPIFPLAHLRHTS